MTNSIHLLLVWQVYKAKIMHYATLLVIRSVTDALRALSRFVKYVGVEAAGRTPLHILQTFFGSEVR